MTQASLKNEYSNDNKKFTINPKTGRSIAVGGRMWRKMVKQGVIDNANYEKPNVLYTVNEDEYIRPDGSGVDKEQVKEEVYRQKEKFTIANKDKHRRPMVYKNQVIMGDNKLTTQEASQLTADAAVEVIDDIQNNEEQLPPNMSRDEAHEYLQGMIFDRMLTNKQKFINKRLQPTRPKRQLQPVLKRAVTNVNKRPRDKPKLNIRTKPKANRIATLKPLKRVPKKKLEPEPIYVDEVDCFDQDQEQHQYEYVDSAASQLRIDGSDTDQSYEYDGEEEDEKIGTNFSGEEEVDPHGSSLINERYENDRFYSEE